MTCFNARVGMGEFGAIRSARHGAAGGLPRAGGVAVSGHATRPAARGLLAAPASSV